MMGLRRFALPFVLVVSVFAGSLATPAGKHNVAKRNAEEAGSTGTEATNIVDLISAERVPTADGGLRFTVCFTKNIEVLRAKVYDRVGPPRVLAITNGCAGGSTVSFTVANTTVGGKDPWLILGDDQYNRMIKLELENKPGPESDDSFVSAPVLQLSPGELVYEPGQNITLTLSLPFGNGFTIGSIGSLSPTLQAVDLDTQVFHQYFSPSTIFDVSNPIISADGIQGDVILQTSTNRISGYLEINLKIRFRGDLVDSLKVSRIIEIHPSNQQGALPPEYLSFMDSPEQSSPTTGNEIQECSVGSVCPIACYAIGENISGLEVFKVQPGGALTEVPTAESGPEDVSYFRSMHWTFQAEADSGNSDGITTFKCQARDEIHGKTATKLIDVQARIPIKIVGERTNLTVAVDETNSHLRTVTLTCVVTGRPSPTVNIYSGYSMDPNPGQSAQTSESTGQDELTVTKVIHNVHVSTLHQLHRERQYYSSPYCEAYHGSYDDYTQHLFEIPAVC